MPSRFALSGGEEGEHFRLVGCQARVAGDGDERGSAALKGVVELEAEFLQAGGDVLLGLRRLVVLREIEAWQVGEEAVDLGVLDDESGEVARDDASEAAQQGLDLQQASAKPLLGLQRALHPVPHVRRAVVPGLRTSAYSANSTHMI